MGAVMNGLRTRRMRMLWRTAGPAMVAVMLIAIAGCSSFKTSGADGADGDNGSAERSSTPNTAGLAARGQSPIADVPVPVGFELDESVSRGFESSGARFIDHTYVGDAKKHAVEDFYRRHMPNKGWQLRGAQMTQGTYLLKYEKNDELCDVRINTEKSALGNERTRIHITVQTTK